MSRRHAARIERRRATDVRRSDVFSFDNFAMTIVVALIVLAWASFLSVILAG